MKLLTYLLLILSSLGTHGQESSLEDLDMKCPQDNTRLFRTDDLEPITMEACEALCYDTQYCEYFSIGVSPADDRHIGVCIGCTSDATLVNHEGFNAYKMTELQDFPEQPCLQDLDEFVMNGCDYESFVETLQRYIDDKADLSCRNKNAEDELALIYPQPEIVISELCADEWLNVPTSSFSDIDQRFSSDFMNEYTLGDTFLNTQTGSFQGTEEGNNIGDFRDDEATSTILEEVPLLSNCGLQSIMCCFGRDRQPNDGNGNCADPIESKCIDADPADNSNLCYTETDIPTFSDPFTFSDKSEGSIHCHGLAWAADENDFTAQLRYNNFFFVSLYDHMYQRGYVETSVDSDNIPMCACVEDMPPVSRSDCTQVDVNLDFNVVFNGSFEINAVVDTMQVEFNSCQGINPSNGNNQNNDLGSYVFRLNQEGKVSDGIMEEIFETLVGYARPGDNQNEEACEDAYNRRFTVPPYGDAGNKKCPQDNTRLFRTDDLEPITMEACQALCYDTQFCEYFSIGVSPANDSNTGVCIGCTSDATLVDHAGFVAYKMTELQDFPDSEFHDPAGVNSKCPSDSDKRLFRTPNDSPLSLEACHELCYDTEGCEYFSIGVNPASDSHIGVCMGCTGDSILEENQGFYAYQMEILQDFPTAAPSGDSIYYDPAGVNTKCPSNSDTRLFRTPDNSPLSLEQCHERCFNTEGCEYFSLGVSPAKAGHVGVCIGCTAEAVLQEHQGFDAYQMSIFQDFPTAAPIEDMSQFYGKAGDNVKCPGNNRLFRTADGDKHSVVECYQKCKDTQGCTHFTFGESATLPDNWKGLCIGCTSGASLAAHNGFNTYEIFN